MPSQKQVNELLELHLEIISASIELKSLAKVLLSLGKVLHRIGGFTRSMKGEVSKAGHSDGSLGLLSDESDNNVRRDLH